LLEGTDAVTFSSNGQVKLGPKSLDLGITAFAYGETMGKESDIQKNNCDIFRVISMFINTQG